MKSGYKIMHNYYTKPYTGYQQPLKLKYKKITLIRYELINVF